MNTNQIDALTTYLEFHLLTFVEETSKHVSDEDVIGDMYDRAYQILQDVEKVLDTQALLEPSD